MKKQHDRLFLIEIVLGCSNGAAYFFSEMIIYILELRIHRNQY